jgi:hypothetical protein
VHPQGALDAESAPCGFDLESVGYRLRLKLRLWLMQTAGSVQAFCRSSVTLTKRTSYLALMFLLLLLLFGSAAPL